MAAVEESLPLKFLLAACRRVGGVVAEEETMDERGTPAAVGSDGRRNPTTAVVPPRMSRVGRRRERDDFIACMA